MNSTSIPAPPKIKSAASPGAFAAIVSAAVVAGIAAVVFFFNPSTHGFYPTCLFHRLTGLNCPGCGGTRALYALLHGQFRAAFRDNALFLLLLAAAVARVAWVLAAKRFNRPVGKIFPANLLWLLLMVGVVFSVLRNLPAFAFLSP